MLSLAFAVFLSGCAPPGPRALLAGKKLLDRGDYAGAVAELKTATTLLATNATAWNDYGVALQHAGQPGDAAQAYQNALKFDRDLLEAHYNLGCLWLEQNKFADAKAEFTAYTLRRNNSPEGWLKLGTAQLKLREFVSAEKSFSTALSLNQNNAEALNGFGLARAQEGRPQDAVRFFAAAVAAHPDYAPARLNLATVEWLPLHDEAQALNNYRAYLALTPRPADWDAVNDLVSHLEPRALVAAENTPPAREPETTLAKKPSAAETRPAPPAAAPHPALPPKTQPVERSNPAPRGGGAASVATPRPEIEKVGPEPVIVSAPPKSNARRRTEALFSPRATENYAKSGVTPLPEVSPPATAPEKLPPPAAVVKVPAPAPPVFPRYLYLSPAKPRAGDRKAAIRAFTEAQQAGQKENLTQALNGYRRAAALDPSWFDAQYNYAVLAYGQKDYSQALAASEMALALDPGSADARYNFALTLKAAGYVTDAVNELNKILATHPDEARAELALGNLYAEQMRDPGRARPHYLRWLELDPRNPEVTNIRFWLSANPP